jgi:hypothetical protein
MRQLKMSSRSVQFLVALRLMCGVCTRMKALFSVLQLTSCVRLYRPSSSDCDEFTMETDYISKNAGVAFVGEPRVSI